MGLGAWGVSLRVVNFARGNLLKSVAAKSPLARAVAARLDVRPANVFSQARRPLAALARPWLLALLRDGLVRCGR